MMYENGAVLFAQQCALYTAVPHAILGTKFRLDWRFQDSYGTLSG